MDTIDKPKWQAIKPLVTNSRVTKDRQAAIYLKMVRLVARPFRAGRSC